MTDHKIKTTTIEREIEMATKSPEVEIAVLNNDIKHISESMARMEQKFDLAIGNFVTVDKLMDAQNVASEKHKEIDGRLNKLEAWNTWFIRIVLGAVLLAGIALVVHPNIPKL